MQSDSGFTLSELVIVVLIIGILVAMAIPVFASATSQAEARTCRANQRVLEGAATTWLTSGDGRKIADIEGVVDAENPVVRDNIVVMPPSCPSAPNPADIQHPTAAEGAYTFTAVGVVEACTFGKLGAHGRYAD